MEKAQFHFVLIKICSETCTILFLSLVFIITTRSIFVVIMDRSTTDKDESPKCLTHFRGAFMSLLLKQRQQQSSITSEWVVTMR